MNWVKATIITTAILGFTACGLEKDGTKKQGLHNPVTSPSDPGPTEEAQQQALAVADVMTHYCYPCHGENGSSEGGFDYADDLAKLSASTLVAPGDPDGSKLYSRVASGDMPPASFGKKPSASEVAALKTWITSGAVAVETKGRMITPTEVKKLIETDIAAIPEAERSGVAYFDLSHIYSGSSIGHANQVRKAFFKFVNSVSSAATIITPTALNEEKTVFKITLTDFGWELEDINNLRVQHPYPIDSTAQIQKFPFPDAPQDDIDLEEKIGAPGAPKPGANIDPPQNPIQNSTGVAQASYFRIDWFLKVASRAPHYYNLLNTPTRLFLLEQKIGVDTVANLQAGRVVRAGFANSQVASHQRVIERHATPAGALWRTFEFGSSIAQKNIFQSPLGPGAVFEEHSDKRFVADGHELIYHLPNGLLGFAIFNGDGNRLNQAPSGQNDGIKENGNINVGVSCMSCHKAGFIDKEDQVAESATTIPGLFTTKELELIASLYAGPAVITENITADSAKYQQALAALEINPEADDPISTTARRYSEPMGLSEGAAYLGLTPEALTEKVKASESLQQLLYGAIAGNSIDRQFWEQNFQNIRRLVENPDLGSILPNPIEGPCPNCSTGVSSGGGGSRPPPIADIDDDIDREDR